MKRLTGNLTNVTLLYPALLPVAPFELPAAFFFFFLFFAGCCDPAEPEAAPVAASEDLSAADLSAAAFLLVCFLALPTLPEAWP